MRFIYRVTESIRREIEVSLEVSEEEMNTLTHHELEQRAVEDAKLPVDQMVTEEQISYRADLLRRER